MLNMHTGAFENVACGEHWAAAILGFLYSGMLNVSQDFGNSEQAPR